MKHTIIKGSFYAIRRGKDAPIVVHTWNDCRKRVNKFPGAQFKKFKTKQEAQTYLFENTHIVETTEYNDLDYADVYTDGACPKNGNAVVAGCGVYVPWDKTQNISVKLEKEPYTSTRAEIMAVLLAIENIQIPQDKKLHILTDSQFVISCVTQYIPRWLVTGWIKHDNCPVKNQDLLKPLAVLLQTHDIRFSHVYGHCGIHGNEEADRLAVKACKQ